MMTKKRLPLIFRMSRPSTPDEPQKDLNPIGDTPGAPGGNRDVLQIPVATGHGSGQAGNEQAQTELIGWGW